MFSENLQASEKNILSLRSRMNDFYELTKPRLSFLSVLTAIAGYLAANTPFDILVFTSLVLGTSLSAAGAATLNQWLEKDADAKMARTRERAIPSGRVIPRQALLFGFTLSFVGCCILFFGVNLLGGLLNLATVIIYLFIYTPLKKLTVWNTVVGAVPGALPPVIGCVVAEGEISLLAMCLFLIIFLWQMPHFYAIAWTYRKDYARGGFLMLSTVDDGRKVAVQSFLFCVALNICLLLLVVLIEVSLFFVIISTIPGFYLLLASVIFLDKNQRDLAARKLFYTSILYLPTVLLFLIVDLRLL